MKNKITTKFSSCLLFLGVGFLMLFSPLIGKAQNNPKVKCEWRLKLVEEMVPESYYNVSTQRYEQRMISKFVSKNVYECVPVSNTDSKTVSNEISVNSSNKYSAPIDSPILGTWKYQDGCTTTGVFGFRSTSCSRNSAYIYSQDGVVQSIHIVNLESQTIMGNWKYTAEDKSSGILEEFKDGKLIERGSVKFFGKSQLQYKITSSEVPELIGKTYIWNKQ